MVVLKRLAATLFVAAAISAGSAQAATFYPASVTASSEYAGFGANFAIDAGGSNTDWAANSTGAGSYLNIDLGAVYTLVTAFVTDRVTSGASNPSFPLGSLDFTRSFQLQATDSLFNPIGAAIVVSGLNPPPTGLATLVALGGLTTQYLRYTVLVTDGVNPGLSDLQFDGSLATPIPGALPLFAGGLGVIGLLAHRRKRRGGTAA